MTVGEGLEEVVRGLVGGLVAAGDGEGVSPAAESAAAMAEEAMAVALEAEANLADVTAGCLEGVAMEACTSRR